MDISLIFLILAAALLHSVWNVIVKGGSDKLLEMVLNTNGGALAAACFLPFLPLPAPESIPYLVTSACVQCAYCVFVAYAYRGGDFTLTYTLMRGAAPLLTALATAFIPSQALSPGGKLGVAVLSLGIFALALDAVRRGKGAAPDARTVGFVLAGAGSIMVYTVLDGTGVRLAGSAPAYICWEFFLTTLPMCAFAFALRGRACLAYAKTRWKYGAFGGVCGFMAYGASVWAMSRAPIALVAALRETSVIFGMLLAVFFLKERLTPVRATAVVLVACGAAGMKMLS